MQESLTALQQPEYLHVILNHLPIIGLLFGILALGFAFFQKSRPTEVAAYGLIALAAFSIFPVVATGEKAYDRMEGLTDKDGMKWLREHGRRVERVEWIFYVTGASAMLGLTVPRFSARSARPILLLTGALALAAFLSALWIASPGGKIMHREFRYAAPAET